VTRSAADRRVRAIAHRGASGERPENTLAAFDEAVRQGCDGIELDLQLSRDGVVVVHHDRTARKLGGGRRRIGAMDLVEILKLDAGAWFDSDFSGERVPTLARVLERVRPPTELLLELKPRGDRDDDLRLIAAAVADIRRSDAAARAFALCFDADVLEQTGRLAPELRRVLNVGRSGAAAALRRYRSGGLAALSFDVRELTAPTMRALRREGAPLFVFTCNRLAEVERALEAGARAVMSDRPAWLVRTLRDAAAPGSLASGERRD
jgi:glycerophosphoryl diester phosphodiesterase